MNRPRPTPISPLRPPEPDYDGTLADVFRTTYAETHSVGDALRAAFGAHRVGLRDASAPWVEEAIRAVARRHALPVDHILDARQGQPTALAARAELCWTLRHRNPPLSLAAIARRMGVSKTRVLADLRRHQVRVDGAAGRVGATEAA